MNAGNQPAGGGGAGAQKRPLDGPGGNMEQKRARMEPVVPPEQESLPQEGASMDLDALKRRFEALQQEVRWCFLCFACVFSCLVVWLLGERRLHLWCWLGCCDDPGSDAVCDALWQMLQKCMFACNAYSAVATAPTTLVALLLSIAASFLQANRFARDTGHSVAIFTVGGVFSDMEDVTDPAGDLYALDVKDKNNSPVQQGLKVTVLKYGTGGVSKQLATRGEIVKFVSARGSKAMQELHAFSREEQNQASA
jgi:hypothetical protein